MNVTVSVCIVTFNSAEDIATCIEGVMNQSFPVQDIFIVDNDSKDETISVIKNLQVQYPKIKIIYNNVNNGFAGGQNQAISHATGDYILVLNPDVELDKQFVELIVEELEKDKHIGSASGLLKLKSDPVLVDSTGLHMPFNRHAVDRGMGDYVENWLEGGVIFGPSGAAAVYKREMIEAIKLDGEFFDEHFFAYKEDVDVAWRANLLGWKSIFVPQATGLHARGWKSGGRHNISLFVRQHSYMNQLFMLIKNEQWDYKMIVRLPVLVTRELLKLMYILLKERDLLSSWKQIIHLLPTMLQKRRLIRQKIMQLKKVTFQNK